VDGWCDVTDGGADEGGADEGGADEGELSTAAGRGAAGALAGGWIAAGLLLGFGLGFDGACVDGAGGGSGVFDAGGRAVVPVAESYKSRGEVSDDASVDESVPGGGGD